MQNPDEAIEQYQLAKKDRERLERMRHIGWHKIIAAAKEADSGFIGDESFSLGTSLVGLEAIERFYAIAHEDGRQADKADAERYRWLCEQNEKGVGYFHLAFAARNIMNWKTKTEIDDGIDRARGETMSLRLLRECLFRRDAEIAELVAALERMRVAGGSQEFYIAWELAKDVLAKVKKP